VARLESVVARLERTLAERDEMLAESRARIAELEKLLEDARRSGKRQAAPFRRRDEPIDEARRPGRRSGEAHGRHGHRLAPPDPDRIGGWSTATAWCVVERERSGRRRRGRRSLRASPRGWCRGCDR
jgi:hypothetical protein